VRVRVLRDCTDIDIQGTETGCTEKICTESVCTEIVLYRKRPTPFQELRTIHRHLNRALKLFKRHINRTVQLKQIKI